MINTSGLVEKHWLCRMKIWGKPKKRRKQGMRVLFIGNSHTYFNDMPEIFAELARKKGIACEVTMITHGGWFLHQHQKEPEVRFNILYGNYDYVVLQEHAHPFGPKEDMLEAAKAINQWIQEAGSTPVAYMTWAEKTNEAGQRKMTEAYREMAEQLGAVLAPVGEEWWRYKQAIRKRKCMRLTASMPQRPVPGWLRKSCCG